MAIEQDSVLSHALHDFFGGELDCDSLGIALMI